MAIEDDFSVAVNGDIRHVSGTETFTVLELHRYLQNLADDAVASGNDLIDITSDTPSDRSTDNIIALLGNYNIDDDAAEYLYDGSVMQADGDELYSGLVVVGRVNSATTLQVIQNNTLYGGADPFWGTGLNAVPSENILMQCLIKTRTGGVDIDGKKIRVQARKLGDTFAEFEVTMGLGNAVAAIFTNQDLNNQTAEATIAGWTTITNDSEGHNLIDLGNGSGNRAYYSKWNKNTYSINQLYERAKWLTRRGATSYDLYGLDGELFRGVTHQVQVDTPSGTYATYEFVSWSGGGAQMLAIDSCTNPTKMWIQLLKGVAPTDGQTITGSYSTATCLVDTNVTARNISPCFIGQSTGSALIGAYGIGAEPDTLTNNDKLFDLTNTQQIPPNNVTWTLSGLVANEDTVLVGPRSGSTLHKNQLTLANTYTSGTVLQVTTYIPVDTPSTGTIRVEKPNGVYAKISYSAYTTYEFTVPTITTTYGAGADVFIGYIDKLATYTSVAFTTIFNAERPLYVRVRDGGGTPIKTFETPSTLTSAGGGTTAIRTTDE